MRKTDLKKMKLQNTSGVYIFYGCKRSILYIGKATCIKSRVMSYFNDTLTQNRGPLIAKMIEEAESVECIKTDSALEALILEADLIKKYQPIYNSKEKSNKSFNYVVITKEDFPRILIVRERELLGSPTSKLKYKYAFGPFTQGSVLKEALKIIRKIFPYRDKCQPPRKGSPSRQSLVKPCFYRQINLCPGVCSGEISKIDYAHTIRNITLLFKGKKSALLKKLTKEMQEAVKKENFESAVKLRNKIFALKHIKDTSLIKNNFSTDYTDGTDGNPITISIRIEAYDVAHMSEQNRIGVMVVVQDGEVNKKEYKKFKIKTLEQGDIAALKEILQRRFAHSEWKLPQLIVVDGGKAQINIAKKVLKEFGYKMPIVGVIKDEKHKPKQIIWDCPKRLLGQSREREVLLANTEAHRFAIAYHRQKRDKIK